MFSDFYKKMIESTFFEPKTAQRAAVKEGATRVLFFLYFFTLLINRVSSLELFTVLKGGAFLYGNPTLNIS